MIDHLGAVSRIPGKGIEDIVELQYTDRKILAHNYDNLAGAGGADSADGRTGRR